MSYYSYSFDFKYEVVMAFENSDYTLKELTEKYNISEMSILRWSKLFQSKGIEGLSTSKGWKPYPKELKKKAIQDYLSGEYSLAEVVYKYGISTTSLLQRWIKMYNSHRELKDTGKGRSISMAKGRKTTWEERIKIAQDCLASDKNYQETADQYQVSYQQVYQWVRKYESRGLESLQDSRGQSKKEETLTPEEKNQLKIRCIQKENERLCAENALLKKLEEIERRRD